MDIHFSPLSLRDQAQYRQYLAACSQKPSDYSFVNLWGWGKEYGLEWAFLDSYVLLRQTFPQTLYWAPIGNWEQIDWEGFRAALPQDICFIRIPEHLKLIWERQLPGIQARECREHWDYLYDVHELIDLKGRKFHKKKNLLNQFLRDYDAKFVLLDEKTVECALALQTDWFLWRDTENDQTLNAENRAIIKIMHDWSDLPGLLGAGLVVDEKMIAYTIAEALDDRSVVIHFEKGCPQFKGVYQAINQMFLEQSCQGYQLVNREQDLGDEGLRKAKLSYNPVDFLRKYRVCLKGTLN
ncbi:phosphatidylglycerol lysyltransferase domain-containing protein [Desulfovibrionales bacterium]